MSKTGIKAGLLGADGNVYALFSICRRALCRAGRLELWDEFYKEATSGDYNHALATMVDYFDVCEKGKENEEDE